MVCSSVLTLYAESALHPSQDPQNIPVPQLSPDEAESFWKDVHKAHEQNTYALVFRLKHKHKHENFVEEEGWLYHFTNAKGEHWWRLYFPNTHRQYFLKDTLEAWGYADEKVFKLEKASIFQPLSPQNNYSLYDLSLLFMHWPREKYLESKRFLGRKSHTFSLRPPADVAEYLGPIRICVDAHFLSLLKAEWLELNNPNIHRKLNILSFQKTQEGVWFAKCFELLDSSSCSKTELKIVFCTFNPKPDGLYCIKAEDLAQAPPYPSSL
jgi:hypothetical protein